LRRAGTLGDGFHSSAIGPSQYGRRLPVLRAAAEAAKRSMPSLSARVRVEFETSSGGYAMRGSPDEIAAEVQAFADLGVTHLALSFGTTDPDEVVERAERFARDVVPLLA